MTGFVVDASVAIKWFVTEPGTEEALALLETGSVLHAPDLIIAETCNIGWRKARVGEILPEDVKVIARDLCRSFQEIVPGDLLSARAVEIALALNHPVYDAFYLALAEARDLPLVTADRRLADRAAGTPWASLVRPLT